MKKNVIPFVFSIVVRGTGVAAKERALCLKDSGGGGDGGHSGDDGVGNIAVTPPLPVERASGVTRRLHF